MPRPLGEFGSRTPRSSSGSADLRPTHAPSADSLRPPPGRALSGEPIRQARDAGAPIHAFAELQLPPHEARIGYVVALVSCAPVGEGDLDLAVELSLDEADQLHQADRVGRAATQIEGSARHLADAP